MNGYKVFYNGRSIDVYAETLLEAHQRGLDAFKPPKSKRHMVHAHLCETNTSGPDNPGKMVAHTATE
jgi:hypothetical protein